MGFAQFMSREAVNKQMKFREKRGIPGVNSDAYHLGYFEDTSSYRSRPPVHTKYDSLIETLYIFGALLLLMLIITGIIFGIREYTFSMKKRRRMFSAGSAWSSTSVITLRGVSDRLTQNVIMQQQKNPAYPALRQINDALNGVRANGATNQLQFEAVSPNSDIEETLFTDARETARQQEAFGQNDFIPLEIVQASPDYSSNSLEEFVLDQADFLKTSNLHKKVYSIRELYQLKPAEYHGRPLSASNEKIYEPLSVEQATKLSIPFNNISFKSAWTAEKTLTEISLYLTDEMVPRQPMNDHATKKIAILRFIAINANSNLLKNPNIFLPPLHRTMDSLIDSGIVFQLLNESNVYVSKSLIEVLMQYCYAHWHFADIEKDSFIHTQFAKWKMNLPVIQPHHVLFRYLVNLELGIYSAENLDVNLLRASEEKIVTLLNHFVEESHCNDYLGFIPIVSQAIDYSERVYSQILFYHLLHIIVKKHGNCCMDEYLSDDKSDLKHVVQSGFWIKNDPAIRKLTEKIHMIILTKNTQAMTWWKEIDGGRIYISTSPREVQLKCDTSDLKNSQRSITPGSWIADPTEKKARTPPV